MKNSGSIKEPIYTSLKPNCGDFTPFTWISLPKQWILNIWWIKEKRWRNTKIKGFRY